MRWAGSQCQTQTHQRHFSTSWSCFSPVGKISRPFTLTNFFLPLDYATDLGVLSFSFQTKITSTLWLLRIVSSTTFIFLFYDGWSKVSFVKTVAKRICSVCRNLRDGQLCKISYPINGFMDIRWGVMSNQSFGFLFRSLGICFFFIVFTFIWNILSPSFNS